MNLLPIIVLALIILKNAGVYISACSLLPGGMPKCFPDAVDYDSDTNKIKEIKYRLDKKHIFGFDINADGQDVRLGQYWVTQYGSKSHTVMCRKDTSEGAYLPSYATYLYDYRHDAEIVVGKSPVTILFIITKKEVWNCGDSKSVKFKRVVTELVSRKPLGSIFFYDGIEVTTAKIPYYCSEKKQLYMLNAAIAREVKYIDPNNGNNVIRYDGHLQFEKREGEDSSVFESVREESNTYEESGFHREVSSSVSQQKNYVDLQNKEGIVFEDIHRAHGEIGSDRSRAICKIQDEEIPYNPEYYITHWAQRKVGTDGYRQHKVVPYKFLEYFIVTKHEFWTCTMEDGSGTFERRVLEYIGMESIKTMDYYDGIKVWKYNMDETKKSVGIRAVFYYDSRHSLQRMEYDGLVKLEEIVEEEKPKTPKKGGFWTLLKNLFSKEEDMPEDQYKLTFDENDDSKIIKRKKQN